MRAAAPTIACMLLLAGCGRKEEAAAPVEAAAPAPAPAAVQLDPRAVDFKRDLNLLGTEPFWAVQIRQGGITYSAPGQPDLSGDNRGPMIEGGQAVWTTQAQGQAIKATVTSAVCQDGMSGLLYPFRADIEVVGVRMQGCAAYADAMPREGG